MSIEKHYEEGSSVRNQYIAAIIINILGFCHGCAIGWTSPMLSVLSEIDGPLPMPLTFSERSWVGSLICIGGLIGTPIFGLISDKRGRKASLVFSAFPILGAWIIKALFKSPTAIMVARVIAGIGGAGAFMIITTYCVEIATTKTRGFLGSFMVFSINGGIVSMYIMGSYMSYNAVSWLMISFPIVFILLSFKIPESPVFLLKNNKDEQASKAIAWLRNIPMQSVALQNIIESIKYDIELAKTAQKEIKIETESTKDKISIRETSDFEGSPWIFLFTSKPTLKAFFVYFSLLTSQCFVGMFAVITYSNMIFAQAGSHLPSTICIIIIGFLQFVGSIIATSLIERTGRKILLGSSFIIISLSMFSLGMFFYMKSFGYDVSTIGWIPVTALSLGVSSFAMGVGPIPYILPNEIIVVQARGLASTIGCLWVWLLSFFISQFFNYFVEFLGLCTVFWLFSGVGIIGAIITVFCLPETKGKSFESILDFYRGSKEKSNSCNNEVML